ncbi:hypothetical protein [Thermoactinospora rubra]|uniref:hypothetical protein n=1 Tax=Thermoactinospora rubra TaxID=1088767 RepID=UPI000A0FADB6|nr:hypothetical protein [Thermoactinospora rubra]
MIPQPKSDDVDDDITVSLGEIRQEWCARCLKSTLDTATIYAFAGTGAYVIGAYAVCEECGWSPYADKRAG